MDILGAIIPAAASLIGGLIGKDSASDAAQVQARAGREAIDFQRESRDLARSDLAPWRQAGNVSLDQLMESMPKLLRPFSMADYQADPGYGFRMAEGLKALERGAGLRHGLESGDTLKDLTSFAQGLASQEFGNAFNRYNQNQTNQYNRLFGLSGMGQNAAAGMGGFAAGAGNSIADLMTQIGNAQAGGLMGGANALSSAIGQGLGVYQGNQLLNAIQGRQSGYGNTLLPFGLDGGLEFDTGGFEFDTGYY